MKSLTIIALILILILCSGCWLSEYMHKPDEITAGVIISETNYGHLGRAPTTGMYIGGVWYRTERLRR